MVVGVNSGWEEMKGCEDQDEVTVAVRDMVGGTVVLLCAPDGWMVLKLEGLTERGVHPYLAAHTLGLPTSSPQSWAGRSTHIWSCRHMEVLCLLLPPTPCCHPG